MKNLIAALFFLICVTAHAANPSMAQLNFASNSLVAQISAGQVWTKTNSAAFIPDAATNAMFISSNRSLMLGLGAWRQYFPSPPLSADNGVYILHQADLGEATTRSQVSVESVNSDAYSVDNFAFLTTDTNSTELYLTGPNGSYLDVWFYDATIPFPFVLSMSNIIVLAANSTVTTNATPLDVAGQLGLYKGTNYINFPATNTPPASALAPVRWITVTVDGTIYRMPLYL